MDDGLLARLQALVGQIDVLLAQGHVFTDEEVLQLSRDMDELVTSVMSERVQNHGTNHI